MKTWICEICGDAYIGSEKPADCPFCGAPASFIKAGGEANPVVNRKTEEVGEISRNNLMETYNLEVKASALYLCMAGAAHSYEIKAMYKRLAKIELEHAVIVTKILGMKAPEVDPDECSQEDIENFKQTIELEQHASSLYAGFAKAADEERIRILFTALAQAERGHIELIQNYL